MACWFKQSATEQQQHDLCPVSFSFIGVVWRRAARNRHTAALYYVSVTWWRRGSHLTEWLSIMPKVHKASWDVMWLVLTSAIDVSAAL